MSEPPASSSSSNPPDQTLISTPDGKAATHSSLSPQERTSSGAANPPVSNGTVVDVGSRLGPYQMLAKLGEGGMGAVYKANHTKLDKLVALKILPQHVMSRPDALARFEREMKAVGKLQHPNIVQAHDAGEFNGVHYLSMEYVEGQDLQQVVASKGPMSILNACKAIRQAAQGLAAAHKLGLVHRDIKPSNLFVTKQTGQIKILDMGLALLSQEEVPAALTSTGQCFGTPDYMAPEQWNDAHTCDARADLYSLGCTLFFLLVGRPPYYSETHRSAANKMKGHVLDPIPNLRSARPDVPESLEAVYLKLMAKTPEDRFSSASELVDALAPFTRNTSPLPGSPAVSPEATRSQADVPKRSGTAAVSADPCDTTSTWKPQPNAPAGEPAVPIPDAPQLVTPVPNQGEVMPQMVVEPRKPAERETEDWQGLPIVTTTSVMPRSRAKRRQHWSPVVISLGVMALIVMAAAYVIRVQTPQGELVIHSDIEGIAVKVRKDGEEVIKEWKIVQGTDNKKFIRTGKIEIELPAELAGEFTVTPESVTLMKGKQEIVKIERKAQFKPATPYTPAHVVLPGPLSADRKAAEWVVANGGTCHLHDLESGESRWLKPGDGLPNGRFVVFGVAGVESMRNSDFQILEGLTSLTRLDMSREIDNGALTHVAQLKSLLNLGCHIPNIGTSAFVELRALPFLTHLTMFGKQVDDRWAFLGSLDSMWTLTIGDFVPAADDFDAWSKYKQLHTIRMDTTQAIDVGILADFQRKHQGCRIIGGYPTAPLVLGIDPVRRTIEQLIPKGVEFTVELPNPPGIRRVKQTSSQLVPEGQFFYFYEVYLPSESFLTQDDLRPLGNCSFDRLYAQGRKQTDALIQALPPRLAVYAYNLADSDLTDEGLKHLRGIAWLKDLDVQRTRVTEAGLKAFHATNPYCQITSDFGVMERDFKAVPEPVAGPTGPAAPNSNE